MKRRPSVLLAALAAALLGSEAFGGSTGTTHITHQGSGENVQSGDFIMANTGIGLDTFARYFIEVLPAQTRLEVDIFDADVGAGAGEQDAQGAANRDRFRTSTPNYNTSVTYTLLDPSGAQRAFLFADASTAGADNVWTALYDSSFPVFQGQTTATTGAATQLTINVPAGTAANDLLIAAIAKDGSGAIDTIAGWTLVDEGSCPTSSCRLGVYRRVATAGEPASYTFTWTGSEEGAGAILRYTNVNTAAPIDVSGNATGTSDTPTAPSVTTNFVNTRIVRLFGADDNDLSATPYPANHIGLFNLDGGASVTAGGAHTTQAAIAATGTAAFQLSASEQWRAVTLAIRPPTAIPAPANGHWELRVDMSDQVTTGNDINAMGIRAHDGNSGAGGSEYNIYADTHTGYGTNAAGLTRTYTYYPYVTSGCACSKNDFDWDTSGTTPSATLSNRSGTQLASFTEGQMSGNNAWDRDNIAPATGWTNASNAVEYGLWTLTAGIQGPDANQGNYGNVYIGNYQVGANPPTANPTPDTFRTYIPNDNLAKPTKPYMEQIARYGGVGPVTPTVGMTTRIEIDVYIVNGTPRPIVFSAASNIVTVNVPGAGAVFFGIGSLSQGTILGQPAAGGTGNITWNPGTLAAGATATMVSQVNVTPTMSPQTIPVTGTTSLNGTIGQWVDETGNTTQGRATFLFGPLCELTVSTTVPTPAVVSGLRALETSEGVVVEWTTASEVGAAGYDLYRWEAGERRWTKVNQRLVTALQGAPQGGRYRLRDPGAAGSGRHTYVLREVELGRGGRFHGPYETAVGRERTRASDARVRRAREPEARTLQSLARRQAALAQASVLGGGGQKGALKIGVAESGLYLVSIDAIAAGLGYARPEVLKLLNRGDLALTNFGQPVAWMRASGQRGILFYGQALDSLYSKHNVYWLRSGRGLLMGATRANFPGAGDPSASFQDTESAEVDAFAGTVVATDPEADYWFWDYLAAGDPDLGRKSFGVQAHGVTGSSESELRVDLLGATASGVADEHHVVVRLNGATLGEAHFTGVAATSVELPVPPGMLLEGANSVEVEALLDGGVPLSIVYVDGVAVTHARRFAAVADVRGDGTPTVAVTGFGSPAVSAFDLANPRDPRRVLRVVVEPDPSGYRLRLDPETPETPYYAAAETAWKAPVFVEPVAANGKLRKRGNAADWLVVTTHDLIPAAERLANRRAAQGLQAAVVDVQDVFNEFGDGFATPHALREFLRTASERWSRAPRYVLLAGKGSFDYRDLLGFGGNLVPPLLAPTPHGLFAADGRFGDLVGDDGLPEIAVGRLPVLSAEELDAYVDKLAALEDDAPLARALLLADDPDGDADFGAQSDRIGAAMPEAYAQERVYLTLGGDLAAARDALFAQLQNGQDVVNYTGHGALDRLTEEGLLTSGDAAALTNPRQPILTALTCIINRFEVPGFEALGETLLKRAGGGFAAVWAPTGLSLHDQADLLGEIFYRDLDASPQARLGDLVGSSLRAYRANGGLDWLPDVYNLLGDPATLVKVPEAPAPPPGGGDHVAPPDSTE